MAGPGRPPHVAPDQWGSPPADPRAADVAGVRELLHAAATDGAVMLPVMSAGELYTVCGTSQVLTEDGELRRWAQMTGGDRTQVIAAATYMLMDRELLRLPDQDGTSAAAPLAETVKALLAGPAGARPPDLPMSPPLALIVAARQCPVMVAAGTRPDGVVMGSPRMYGLGEEGRPLRAVVVEMVTDQAHKLFGSLHEFVLMSPAAAGKALAAWAATPLRTRLRRQPQARAISVYRNPPGPGLTCDRLTVTAAGPGRVTLAREPAGPAAPLGPAGLAPVTCGQAELTALLTGILTGEPR